MRTKKTGELHRPTFRGQHKPVKEDVSLILLKLLCDRSRNCQPIIGSREKSVDTNRSVGVDVPLNPWRLSCGKITKRVCYKCGSSEHEGTRAVRATSKANRCRLTETFLCCAREHPRYLPDNCTTTFPQDRRRQARAFFCVDETRSATNGLLLLLLPTTQNCQHEMSRINRYSRLENVGRQVFAGGRTVNQAHVGHIDPCLPNSKAGLGPENAGPATPFTKPRRRASSLEWPPARPCPADRPPRDDKACDDASPTPGRRPPCCRDTAESLRR